MDERINFFKKIRNNNEIEDINKFLNQNSKDYPEILNYKNKLKRLNINIDEKLENKKNNKYFDNFDVLYDKISKNVEMQPWKKIPKYIKNNKIRNYVNTLQDIENPDLYYKDILKKIELKKIKNSDILYNQDECIIESIKF